MKQLYLTHTRDKVLVQQTRIDLTVLTTRNIRAIMSRLHMQFRDNRHGKVLLYHYASKHFEYRLRVITNDRRSVFEWVAI